jgi:hypothetical protein
MSKANSYKIVTNKITKIGDHVLPEPRLVSESYMIDGKPVSKEYFEKLNPAGNDPAYNKRGDVMITDKQKSQIAELRAVGTSFQKIALELKISKPTIINAAREMEYLIINMRNIEIEALMDKLELTHRHRLETLSKMLEKLRTDILSRDLSEIPADKLIELYMKIEVNYSGLLSDLRFQYKAKDMDEVFFQNVKVISP